MNTPAVTFEVSPVRPAKTPLPEVPYAQALGDRLQRPTNPIVSVVAPGDDARSRVIEACSPGRERLVAHVRAHPVIAALHRAFVQHRPLRVSPDMIWLLVCQGVASHVDAHAERLRSQFVQHQGKAPIVVRRDDFQKGAPDNPWGEAIDEISEQVRSHIGPTYDLFVPRFSTTGPTERISAEIVLLDAVQSYFRYTLLSMCGIPSITLEGTAADWQELAERAQAFTRFDLAWWLTSLDPILREFAAAARGVVRRRFWQSIYKYYSFSGGSAVTGWITAFFPYFHGGRNRWLTPGADAWKRLWHDDDSRYLPHQGIGPAPDSFPSGLARAPFQWQYFSSQFDMEFLGGFVGVSQDSATLSLRPEVGWAVCELVSSDRAPRKTPNARLVVREPFEGPDVLLLGEQLHIQRCSSTEAPAASELSHYLDGDRLFLVDRLVSRQHAVLSRLPDGRYSIRDVGSRNGTFVDHVQIKDETPLMPEQEIQIGRCRLQFVVGQRGDMERW